MDLVVEIWDPAKEEYIEYASVDERSGVDRVEIVEFDSAESGIKLPPGYVIESMTRISDHLDETRGPCLLIRAGIYTPDEASVEALRKMKTRQGLLISTHNKQARGK